MTAMTDTINNALRDYNTAGDPGSGAYQPVIADLREDILVPMALFQHCITEVATFALAANAGAARTGIGLGSADNVTFGSLTVTNGIVTDTNTFVVDAVNNRVGIGTATPSTGLTVSLAASFGSTLAATGAVTLSADLTVDTSTLKVDSANNRVGVGTASPGVTFDAVGEARVTSSSASVPALRVVQTGAAAALLVEDQASTDATPFTILADGAVVTGHTAALAAASSVTPGLQVHRTSSAASVGIARYEAAQFGPTVRLVKSRGSGPGVRGLVGANDYAGSVVFDADDGTNYLTIAEILGVVDGSAALADIPGKIVFKVSSGANLQERLALESDGFLTFGGNAGVGLISPDVDNLAFYGGNGETFRIEENSRVIFGHTDSVTVGVDARVQVAGTTDGASLSVARYSDSASPCYITMGKSRSATLGGQTIVQSGDVIGAILAYGSDGTNFEPAAGIYFSVGGTPGNNDMPGQIGFRIVADGSNTLTERYRMTETEFRPTADNVYSLGVTGGRWSTVYAGTGTINTSDATEKTALRPLTADEIAAAGSILDGIGAYQWLDAVAEKGADSARVHIGATAQNVAASLSRRGLDPARFALWCADAVTDDSGRPKIRQSLRPDQVTNLLLASLHARLKALEAAS